MSPVCDRNTASNIPNPISRARSLKLPVTAVGATSLPSDKTISSFPSARAIWRGTEQINDRIHHPKEAACSGERTSKNLNQSPSSGVTVRLSSNSSSSIGLPASMSFPTRRERWSRTRVRMEDSLVPIESKARATVMCLGGTGGSRQPRPGNLSNACLTKSNIVDRRSASPRSTGSNRESIERAR